MQRVHILVILSACIAITILSNSSQAFLFSSSPRNIFKPPEDSEISEIQTSDTPWVIADVIPTIEAFRRNVSIDVQSSDQIQKYWDFQSDSQTTRDIVFRLINKFLTDVGHPVPADLANVISKIGSLFDPITLPILIEADAVHLAEFLLIHNVDIDRSTSKTYVDSVAGALAIADENDIESIWQALLNGYVAFIISQGFNPAEVIDEVLEGLASYLIVLLDKLNVYH